MTPRRNIRFVDLPPLDRHEQAIRGDDDSQGKSRDEEVYDTLCVLVVAVGLAMVMGVLLWLVLR